jgi:hypothetical protein
VSRRDAVPLIDMPTFERVQARLDQHKGQGQRRAAPPRYPFRGLARCAACDQPLRGLHDNRRPHIALQCPQCYRSRTYNKVERVVQEALGGIPLGTAVVGQEGRTPSDAAARVEAITARIEKVRKRRGALIIKREDGIYTEADYLHAIKQTDDELAELEAAREQIMQGAQEEASADETLRWLRTLGSWQEVLDPEETTPAERNAVYRECFKKLVLDYGRNTVTVHWQPALARLRGRESEEIAL